MALPYQGQCSSTNDYGTFLSEQIEQAEQEPLTKNTHQYFVTNADADAALHHNKYNASQTNNQSTAEEIHHAKGKWPEDSWQIKTLHFINSDPVQKLLICLLVLDVLILFTELGELNKRALSCGCK